jgi:hypothetical protein
MKTICSSKRRGSFLPFVLLVLPLTIGCGGQAKGTISGKVTYQEKPCPNGFVTFVPENGAAVHGEIQSDGSYRVANVPLGPVKICIQPKSAEDTLASSPMPRNPEEYGKVMAASAEAGKQQIPPQYADPAKSGLTYSVKQGPQQYDIVLK